MNVLSTASTIGQAFKNAGRAREILTVFGKHGFADLLHRMQLSRFLPAKYAEDPRFKELPIPVRLRMSFEELGPTFVKLGQLLASRPDLIPEPVVQELEKLQDNVVSLPSQEIQRVLEQELGCPIASVFSEFEKTPLAAASIAQVHGAILKTGERVAVKIQRPGIERQIQNDISILRGIAILMERYIPESRAFNPTGLVEEFFQTILFETDFRVEANNVKRIKKNLAVFPKVAVPETYSEFCTSRVLVLERFQGIRFSDRETMLATGIQPKDVVALGADVFFHMVMHDGLFHGDPHAGNFFVLPDGRLGLIDFGIVGRLSRRIRDSIIVMFIAIIDEDYETLANEYVNLCQSTGATDLGRLQKDLMDTISPYVGMNLGEVNVGRLLLRSTAIAVTHHLVVPRELMLLFKAIFTIEALGKRLEPTFDILQVGTKLARQVVTDRYRPERLLQDALIIGRDLQGLVETTPRLLRRFFRVWSQNHFAFEVRNTDIRHLSATLRSLTYYGVLCTTAIGFYAIGICLLCLNRGPLFLEFSFWGEIAIACGTALLGYGLWSLRRRRVR